MLSAHVLLSLLLALGTDPGGRLPASIVTPGPATLPLQPRAQEPPSTPVTIGDPAPDFAYQSFEGRWQRLSHLLEQGPILLVFDPGLEDLRALEAEREALRQAGVHPVAILDEKPGRAWARARDLELTYSLLGDPRQVIARQFNAIQEQNGQMLPAWFVLDRAGEVRALHRGELPPRGWAALASRALGRPQPGASLPTAR